MKKITIKLAGLRLGITLSIILSFLVIGHSESPYSFDELLIRFDPGVSDGYIDSLRLDYNAVEDFSISPSPVSNIHLWRITVFPAGGNNDLNDINEVVGDARGRAKVQSAGLNYSSKVFSIDVDGTIPDIVDPTFLCSNNFSIICDVSNTIVRMSILDTGIGYYKDLNDIPNFFSPELFNPFYGSYIGYDFVNQDIDPYDDHGHGTHIAGIIAEIATMSEAYSIELESFKTHNADGVGKVYDIILAVDESILNGINIINMSFSYKAPPSNKVEPLEFAINNAGNHGILVIAAAGNDNHDNDIVDEPSYPASFSCENMIAVASVDCNKAISSFSNFGAQNVDVSTLGEAIIAPDHTGTLVAKSGTSQATAMVSGMAGILATNLSLFNWSPMKCSILGEAVYHPNLQNLMTTEGIANANNSFGALMGNCGIGYRSESMEEEEIIDTDEVSVYPNPFGESCRLEYKINTAETVVINIYNETGQLIFKNQEALNEGTHIFNWSPKNSIPTGIYFIQILTNSKEVMRKVVKQH